MSSNSEIVSVTYNQNYFTRSKIFMPLEEENEMISGIAEELEQLLDPTSGIDQKVAAQLTAAMQNASISHAVYPAVVISALAGSPKIPPLLR